MSRPQLESDVVAAQKIQGQLFVRGLTDVRAGAAADSPSLAQVDVGQTVDVTGVVEGEWTQVMHNGLPRWVATATLSATEPLGTAPCAAGSAVERGLQPDTVKVYRAVCARFPQIGRYGGRGGGGEHATGRALDIMVSSDVGTQIADFVRANARELGVSQVIWRQRIWTQQLAGGGWRPMSDRGSATANHYDHVHVTTYGNAAS